MKTPPMSPSAQQTEHAEMRCKTCGYDLRGLEESRCPECGRKFNAADRSSFLSWPFRGRRYLTLAIVAVLMMGAPLLYAFLVDLGWVGSPITDTTLIIIGVSLLTGGVTLSMYVAAVSFKAVMDRLPWVEGPRAFVVAFLLSALPYLGFMGMMIFSLLRRVLGS